MKAIVQIYFSLFLSLAAIGQSTISGTIKDIDGEALIGANVYLKGTYDGATSNAQGAFHFETYESDSLILVVSFIGFETLEVSLEDGQTAGLQIALVEAFNAMEAVTITAGAFEASDEKKAVILKSLDIAMTAGATADIPGALNTLPGTQKNGESGRLFVRGGTSAETKVFIDGVEAANFYGTTGPAIPTRSRFSPFLFKGTFFSTGGYSAEFGQALSSTLMLTLSDVDPASKIDLSVMSVGMDASVIRSWDDQSIYAKLAYTNLNPYNRMSPQRVDWKQGTVSPEATFAYKKDYDNGARLRTLGMASTSSFSLEEKTLLTAEGLNAIAVRNDFAFANISYEQPVGTSDFWYIASSITYNYDRTAFNLLTLNGPEVNQHFKTKYNHALSSRTFVNVGAEIFRKSFDEQLTDNSDVHRFDFSQFRPVMFIEVDHYLSKRWVLRSGLRSEYASYLNRFNLAPRLSLAHKINTTDQVSVAAGLFHQDPDNRFLRLTKDLEQERASHLILNFQRIKEKHVLRVEGYLKNYSDLVKYQNEFDPSTYTSDGKGYAYGLDVFWRDNGGIKFLDYWVSYSWLKSERDFLDYPEKASPNFTSEHNVSLVTKRWFPRFKTQMGATYAVTTGRPFDHPNRAGFNESRTPIYHDLSYNLAWLPAKNLILYVSASNLLGQEQIFGYDFSEFTNEQGHYLSEPVKLPAKRFVFIGCFLTIGGHNNQLENL
jgi:hypothetical protein